jgi:uncharacterized surface protein with fasciclin (FAS1) repeats
MLPVAKKATLLYYFYWAFADLLYHLCGLVRCHSFLDSATPISTQQGVTFMRKLWLSIGGLMLVAALFIAPFSGVVMAQDSDIVDTAVAAGDFNTLVAAVDAAGLVETLKGEGPFTVFAPSDAAFAALPEGTVDSLLADPQGALTQILLYHVVPGKVMAGDLSDGLTADTAQGSPVTFTISDSGAMVNNANIVATDIETTNGVIHVIDAVLIPELEAAADTAEAEATPEATEEAMEEAAMTPEATEEAMEEAEATPEATEEAMEEAPAAEMTPEPTEEAMEEGAPEPTTLPVTGASLPSNTLPVLAVVGLALIGAAYFTRRDA